MEGVGVSGRPAAISDSLVPALVGVLERSREWYGGSVLQHCSDLIDSELCLLLAAVL